MRILVVNDDGLESPGIQAISEELKKLGEVWVFSTAEDRSGSSHSITLTHAIRIVKFEERVFKVYGTPADCVNIAVNGIIGDVPDLVVSGINLGENAGDDILYSGTFGGAIEGALLGAKSFAISARVRENKTGDLRVISRISLEIIKTISESVKNHDRLVFNINFPYFHSEKEIKGLKVAELCRRIYGEKALRFQDPRGREFWFIGGKEVKVDSNSVIDPSKIDVFLLDKGYITITPVRVEFKTQISDITAEIEKNLVKRLKESLQT
ncbi:MAG: 5'/3'-nucleotidase SurE [Candidatus Calescibacterium sp.]|nr:5'/3'-nucleotidase SurE [Candidatus Calescibacterium sp.]MCX7733521.1 5'/3'-nucleotidase SurE [bacterium]MDW8087234.1 5'/3'-nucleotidase SurE [Candidatus Calescibacterium sp.]